MVPVKRLGCLRSQVKHMEEENRLMSHSLHAHMFNTVMHVCNLLRYKVHSLKTAGLTHHIQPAS